MTCLTKIRLGEQAAHVRVFLLNDLEASSNNKLQDHGQTLKRGSRGRFHRIPGGTYALCPPESVGAAQPGHQKIYRGRHLESGEGGSMNFAIPIGASVVRRDVVTREQTVAHFVPGMPEVYGTLMLVLHMEMAAAESIQPFLPAGWVSVGIDVNVTHLAATPVGATVTTTATVTAVGERDVTFRVEAHDGVDLIGSGTHRRAPVEIARLMKRASSKVSR